VTSIREVSRLDVILEVKSPGDARENTVAAARGNRMLTTANDLSD